MNSIDVLRAFTACPHYENVDALLVANVVYAGQIFKRVGHTRGKRRLPCLRGAGSAPERAARPGA
jgi:hypothetical protein